MAVKKVAKKAPVKYLEMVMFEPRAVEGKYFLSDNMDYVEPRCIDTVANGDIVAVYEFVGLRKVNKGEITFTKV